MFCTHGRHKCTGMCLFTKTFCVNGASVFNVGLRCGMLPSAKPKPSVHGVVDNDYEAKICVV